MSKFVVIEGMDGAGTTTHVAALASTLSKSGLAVCPTREPSDGPIGMLIRQMLTGRVIVPGISGPRPPSWNTMALLFAADRADHLESTVLPNIRDGITVISDRYYHSSIVYQTATSGDGSEATQWVKTLNSHARAPDLTIVLDVPIELAMKRLANRPKRDLYEEPELLERVAAAYRTMEQYFPGERIVRLDSSRPMAEVAADILKLVQG